MNSIKLTIVALMLLAGMAPPAVCETMDVPSVHANIYATDSGLVYRDSTGLEIAERTVKAPHTLAQMREAIRATETGLEFDFGDPEFNGLVYCGLLHGPEEVKHSYPVFRTYVRVEDGKGNLDIQKYFGGIYDFVGWQESGRLQLGYRVIDDEGTMLYDGKIRVAGTGPFHVDTSIVEGPFINLVTHKSAVVSFETNFAAVPSVEISGQKFSDSEPTTHHEILLTGLTPNTDHVYTVAYGAYRDTYTFRTAPLPGSRLPFTFAYTSDGRANYGGGERDLYGTNAYMLKRIGVACVLRKARFLQYTGDLIGGYSSNRDNMMLEYANWKRAADPFACYIPFVVGIGNHESLSIRFRSEDKRVAIDRFPYSTHSTEAIFAANFVNPHNGPLSEDGSECDPDPLKPDFPPYDETVFCYTYDNIAMIVLNSAYWYSPGSSRSKDVGGNLRGYIMDNQLAWLRETLGLLEEDQNIDHVFVTLHGPIFPNAGYIKGAMWHRGSNEPRPTVAGKPVRKGIIECRDELLDAIMNHSSKVIATLSGHEHSYSLLRVSEDMPMYVDDYQGSRLSRIRPFWHITNGAGGAPYYGPEETIWQEHLHKFSTQNALVLFHVQGKEIRAEVLNPDTMELIQEFDL